MELDVLTICLVCIVVFIAGLVDAIAGGGGLISLPAYILVGLPSQLALGTNKFSSTFGTFFSVMRFMKNGKVNYFCAIYSTIGAIIGSFIGVKLALMLDERYLRYILMILIPIIIIFILIKRDFAKIDNSHLKSKKSKAILSLFIGLILGCYDGFFGPGAGTFLIIVFSAIIGFDVLTSSGNAKMVNLASNVSAVITFLFHGKVLLSIGIPAAIMGILGNLIGSKLAIKNGAAIIRPVFIFILILLFSKIAYDIFL